MRVVCYVDIGLRIVANAVDGGDDDENDDDVLTVATFHELGPVVIYQDAKISQWEKKNSKDVHGSIKFLESARETVITN